jgi:hypothetical protein
MLSSQVWESIKEIQSMALKTGNGGWLEEGLE